MSYNSNHKRLFEEVVIEANNLMAWEKFDTFEERRENARTPRGCTVNALYYAIKALNDSFDKSPISEQLQTNKTDSSKVV